MNGTVVSSVSLSNGTAKGHRKRTRVPQEHFEQPPLVKAIWTYISYGLIILLGHIHDLLRKLGLKKAGSMTTKEVSSVQRTHIQTSSENYTISLHNTIAIRLL